MKHIFKNFIFLILAFLIYWLGFTAEVLAQFETFTPTFTATPIFITGTPVISTVWMGANDSNSEKTPDPISTADISLLTMSENTASMSTPTKTPTDRETTSTIVKISSQTQKPDSGQFSNHSVTLTLNPNHITSTSTPIDSETNLKGMLDFYRMGMKKYSDKNFDLAIFCLKKAISIKDLSVPDYYYAEANAMLGIIYKFDRVDPVLARQYCEAALKIDPATATAQKLIHEIDSSNTEAERNYWTGIGFYEKHEDEKAIHFLKLTVDQNDPATPSFYYAEAYKTLGLIYQFRQADPQQGRLCYQAALKIEPIDETAQKNLAELSN